MGNLVAAPQWVDVPYFEANAVLTGGPDCPDNIPIQALLNRTEYLKGMVENMSLGFDAVPATNKGLFIVVKQPHVRMMMWNGTQYVRAPWNQPCQLFFSYDNPATLPGALPVRADVSYQQSNYPDVVSRLGLSGVGMFSLIEVRGEFLRVLDNGRGVDVGRGLRSYQVGTHITGDDGNQPAVQGIGNMTQVGVDPSDGVARDIFLGGWQNTETISGIYWGMTRPRNVAFPLWMTI